MQKINGHDTPDLLLQKGLSLVLIAIPPTPPFYKTNVDAIVFNKSIGLGVVIPNHERAVIAAPSKHLQLLLGPLEAEATAMDEAVSFAWDIGVRDVVFEIDSSMVTEALSSSTTLPVTIANLIADTVILNINSETSKWLIYNTSSRKGINQPIFWQNMPKESQIL